MSRIIKEGSNRRGWFYTEVLCAFQSLYKGAIVTAELLVFRLSAPKKINLALSQKTQLEVTTQAVPS